MFALFLRLVGSEPHQFKPVVAAETAAELEEFLEGEKNVISYPGATHFKESSMLHMYMPPRGNLKENEFKVSEGVIEVITRPELAQFYDDHVRQIKQEKLNTLMQWDRDFGTIKRIGNVHPIKKT